MRAKVQTNRTLLKVIHSKAVFTHYVLSNLVYVQKLFFNRSTNRAVACASTTRNTFISVDNVDAVTLCDTTTRTSVNTCATSDAIVCNLISHDKHLHKNFTLLF